jgi:tetratricopeptide (TPR) repeat protein
VEADSDSGAPPFAVAPVRPTLAELRGLLAAGDAQGALSLARAQTDEDFLLLSADALRALGRHREAIAAYRALATRTREAARRAQAGFAAAQLAFHGLGDPAEALALIAEFGLCDDASLLRERASALEVDALSALGRLDEAKRAAARYLWREPATETSRRMRALLE